MFRGLRVKGLGFGHQGFRVLDVLGVWEFRVYMAKGWALRVPAAQEFSVGISRLNLWDWTHYC